MIPCTVHGDNGESEKMVAISIYRGNLHRVPDVPRRWLMPNPQISFKDFKLLLLRRSKALSCLRAPTNPNPSSLSKPRIEPPTANVRVIDSGEGPSRKNEVHIASELVGGSSKKPLDGPASFVDSKTDLPRKASERVNGATGNQIEPIRDKGDLLSDKEKRKREIENRLRVLNAKKHNLVLVLKQILNAEEELKRQNSMQGSAMRPSVPFQADGTHDTGPMSKHMAPRMGTEANLGDDVERGATDDLSNHNVHSRHILRTTGMSTSSESPLRRTPSVQQNMVSHPTRASSGATASPSRFALSGHQGNPMNMPSVSVSGTSYIASSPSPAASGGTSVFRDARQPSPWN